MLICVFCLPQCLFGRQPAPAVMWQYPSAFFLKGVLNGVNENWPFVSPKHRQLCGTCWQILNEFVYWVFTTWGARCCTWKHLGLCLPAACRWNRCHPGSLSPSPVSFPSLCSREWQRSDGSAGFYLDAQPERVFTVWRCEWLSVSPFVHVSFKNLQQNELK